MVLIPNIGNMVGRSLGIEEKMKNTLINIIKIAIYLLSMFFIVGFTLVYFYMDRDVRDATIEIYVYDEKHNPITNCEFLLENTSYKEGETTYTIRTNNKGYFKIFLENSASISIYSTNSDTFLYSQEITQKSTHCTILYNQL